ncbi:MAG TPA: glycosyltransferase family 1 protein, partial [bacterium]|nr:glycosyltransferase family 1 protein [bacterium]
MKIVVDVRMMNSSGIGSYIRHLVPLVIQSAPKSEFTLLGSPQEMKECKGFAKGPRVHWIETSSPIFTIFEQIELFKKTPKDTDLFWSPNYNFPVFWRGKLMVTVHDVFHLVMGKGIGSIPKRIYAR